MYHHEREKPWQEKVKFLVSVAREHDCAMRVGVNCGSVDPAKKEQFDPADDLGPMLLERAEHWAAGRAGFERFVVSPKDSDPRKVIEVNQRFSERVPRFPCTWSDRVGMPPDGIIKTRIAFEQLVSRGIGDTIRVSLIVPNHRKHEEIDAGREILADIAVAGECEAWSTTAS
ncbi:MAG: flavodoxin-dependent (E)-4-hydroxy-3-methylbut-2-enyl-diphosphate synthase [Pirellulaceae bacterium]